MKFTISRSVLQKELAFVQGVVERKNTIPSLSNLLIESIDDNKIRISGTDLDVTIRCEVQADKITQAGAVCLSARKLFDIVRLLPDSTIKFSKESNEWVKVECEKSKFRIPGINKEVFPELLQFKGKTFKLSSALLNKMISRIIFAITQEEGRYTLSGAKLEAKDDFRMIATDGHRLAFTSIAKPKSITKDLDVLIPRKVLTELIKLINGLDEEIDFGSDDNHVYFKVGSRELSSRLLTGTFPKYELVFPKGNDKKITFNTADLNKAIKRTALMADDRSHCIQLNFEKDQLLLSAKASEEGESKENLEIDYKYDPVEIGFNEQYIRDFLDAVGTEKIYVELKDGTSQILLKPVDDDSDYQVVIMPLRL